MIAQLTAGSTGIEEEITIGVYGARKTESGRVNVEVFDTFEDMLTAFMEKAVEKLSRA